MKDFKGINFKGTFRVYQQKVLDSANKHLKDGKVHIVAAPGSGKTILGCELIRRLNSPCLIFSPTVTIREQWGDRFKSWFLNDEKQYEELVSYDLFDVKLINSLTYQALYSAMDNVKISDEEETLDYSLIDLFEVMKEKGIKTICLDEAHHLKNEWQKALEKFIKKLDKGIKIISLTATPPYDSTEAEWKRYIDVCGEIDEEIFVPELVKQNTLCPHQDFIYFSYPTEEETEKYKLHKQSAMIAINEISELECVKQLHNEITKDSDRVYAEVYTKRKEMTSLFVFFEFSKLTLSKRNIKLFTGQEVLPSFSFDHADVAIDFMLDMPFVKEEDKALIVEILKKYGLYENKNASINLSEKLKKTLASSMSKLESITEIVAVEKETLKDNLRMLVLTDYIKKDSILKINTEESFDNISIISIFEMLRRKDNTLKLGVLSGAIVILPTELNAQLTKILTINKNDYSSKAIEGTTYCEFTFKGGNKNKVKFVSELFEKGYINVLIGTKSLLGEGWDSPCINSLILASFVGSFVLSNQMRGRAIRIYKGDPDKCSNIWHLVTLEPNMDEIQEDKVKSNDYAVLEKRFKSFVGPNYSTGEIESGIERISNIKTPLKIDNVDDVNESTKQLSQDREKTRLQWLGMPENLEVCIQTQVPTNKRLPSFTISSIICLMLILCVDLVFAYWTTNITGFFGFIFDVLFVALSIYFLICIIVILIKMIKHINAKNSIKTLSFCILKTLQELNHIDKKCKLQVLKRKKSKVVGVALTNASLHEQNVFNKCLSEFFGAHENPRYILVYRNLFNVRDYKRSFICPELLSGNKEIVNILVKYLKSNLTTFEAIYIKNDNAMFNLKKCRSKSYLFDYADEITVKQKLVKK